MCPFEKGHMATRPPVSTFLRIFGATSAYHCPLLVALANVSPMRNYAFVYWLWSFFFSSETHLLTLELWKCAHAWVRVCERDVNDRWDIGYWLLAGELRISRRSTSSIQQAEIENEAFNPKWKERRAGAAEREEGRICNLFLFVIFVIQMMTMVAMMAAEVVAHHQMKQQVKKTKTKNKSPSRWPAGF